MIQELFWDPKGPSPISGTPVAADLEEHLGKEFYWYDPTYQTTVHLRLVKNTSGIALTPGRLVTYKNNTYEQQVDGYADSKPEHGLPIWDRHTGTIANNDLCYLVTAGPCLVKTGPTSGANLVLNVGDWLTNQTNAASTNSTAGGMELADFTGATAPLANAIIRAFGRALTARTTNNTATDTLVWVGRKW